jgi:type II secretory pathway component PulF
MKMFYCSVTLKSGRRIEGVLNALNANDARSQIRQVSDASKIASVSVVSSH